jgi:hypothetical protein
MSFDDLLVNRCRLQTSYSSQNEWNDWTYTYSSASTETVCRLTPISAFERIEGMGRHDDVRYFGYFKSSTAIQQGERLLIGNNTYVIKEVVVDATGHHKECLISEIKV